MLCIRSHFDLLQGCEMRQFAAQALLALPWLLSIAFIPSCRLWIFKLYNPFLIGFSTCSYLVFYRSKILELEPFRSFMLLPSVCNPQKEPATKLPLQMQAGWSLLQSLQRWWDMVSRTMWTDWTNDSAMSFRSCFSFFRCRISPSGHRWQCLQSLPFLQPPSFQNLSFWCEADAEKQRNYIITTTPSTRGCDNFRNKGHR